MLAHQHFSGHYRIGDSLGNTNTEAVAIHTHNHRCSMDQLKKTADELKAYWDAGTYSLSSLQKNLLPQAERIQTREDVEQERNKRAELFDDEVDSDEEEWVDIREASLDAPEVCLTLSLRHKTLLWC